MHGRLTSCKIFKSSSRIFRAGRLRSGNGVSHSLMADITPLSMKVSFKSCLKIENKRLNQQFKSKEKGIFAGSLSISFFIPLSKMTKILKRDGKPFSICLNHLCTNLPVTTICPSDLLVCFLYWARSLNRQAASL